MISDKMIVGNDVQPLRQAALDFKAGGAVTMRCAPLQNDIKAKYCLMSSGRVDRNGFEKLLLLQPEISGTPDDTRTMIASPPPALSDSGEESNLSDSPVTPDGVSTPSNDNDRSGEVSLIRCEFGVP